MKRKYLIPTLWVLIIGFVLLCGTAAALMFHRTEAAENQFIPAYVDCVVHEQLEYYGDYSQGLQDVDLKTSIKVENTSNIDAYIRIRFVSYWEDQNQRIISKPSQMPTISLSSDWIAGADHTYYYTKPVPPGGFTAELLESPIALVQSSEGYYQVVEVFADAIQSLPARAAAEKWGVTIDANGFIISGR